MVFSSYIERQIFLKRKYFYPIRRMRTIDITEMKSGYRN